MVICINWKYNLAWMVAREVHTCALAYCDELTACFCPVGLQKLLATKPSGRMSAKFKATPKRHITLKNPLYFNSCSGD